jgi:hypothetical protein
LQGTSREQQIGGHKQRHLLLARIKSHLRPDQGIDSPQTLRNIGTLGHIRGGDNGGVIEQVSVNAQLPLPIKRRQHLPRRRAIDLQVHSAATGLKTWCSAKMFGDSRVNAPRFKHRAIELGERLAPGFFQGHSDQDNATDQTKRKSAGNTATKHYGKLSGAS